MQSDAWAASFKANAFKSDSDLAIGAPTVDLSFDRFGGKHAK
jgi:hypothetical protein